MAATVISRHGDTIILDAGLKAMGMEEALPRLAGHDATTLFVHEEHSAYDLPARRTRRSATMWR